MGVSPAMGVCKINSSGTVSGDVALSIPEVAGVSVWAPWRVEGLTGARGAADR